MERYLFKKIRPKRVSDEVFKQIMDLILTGKLKPGDRLPPERELAERLGVSRPVVREAISRLVAKGYLDNIQGSGTYVRSITEPYIEETAIQDFLKKGKEALPQVVEVRRILETWSAATAAVRATEKELKQMEEYLREFEEATKQGKLASSADAHFHLCIAYATHNTLLIHLMDSIFNMIERVTYEIGLRTYRDPDSYTHLYIQHLEIFKAIKERDSELAYLNMLRHMMYVEKEIRKMLEVEREAPVYPFVGRRP